jgi:uncharacterized protein YceK
MKIMILLLVALVLVSGCATHSRYDSARLREREYTVDKIALTQGGLSESQIRQISSTVLPTTFPIDLSTILVNLDYIESETEQQLMSNVIREMQTSDKIDRVVPIPEFLLPDKINFAVIQELGIRTLTEYVVVFIIESETVFKWTKIIDTEYETSSEVDFFLVDPKTTAILASDKLYSTIRYKTKIFEREEKEKAMKELFTEQGKILGEILSDLFT